VLQRQRLEPYYAAGQGHRFDLHGGPPECRDLFLSRFDELRFLDALLTTDSRSWLVERL